MNWRESAPIEKNFLLEKYSQVLFSEKFTVCKIHNKKIMNFQFFNGKGLDKISDKKINKLKLGTCNSRYKNI